MSAAVSARDQRAGFDARRRLEFDEHVLWVDALDGGRRGRDLGARLCLLGSSDTAFEISSLYLVEDLFEPSYAADMALIHARVFGGDRRCATIAAI